MAQDYLEEPNANNPNLDLEAVFDGVYVPGEDPDYRVEMQLDAGDFFYEGQMINADEIGIRSSIKDIADEEDGKAVGMFLSYAENDWTTQEMWRNSEYSRGEVQAITGTLEEYGLVETSFEEVDITELGHKAEKVMNTLPKNES